ncbi:hypothetical protein IL306_003945 [Fusarium sp. DS 682]|nr:hypothetical protein IL306_003945 [Fusarium sp. DS 682]
MASQAATSHKQPSVAEASENEDHPQNPKLRSTPYGCYLVDLKDVPLQNAIIAARSKIINSWIKEELKDAKVDNLLDYYKELSSEKQINKISKEVYKKLKKLGRTQSTTSIASEIQNHRDVLDFFIDQAFDKFTEDNEFSERNAREEIERILNVLEAKGNEYDILGIDETIPRSELTQRKRKILLLVHPDKNDHEEANKCSQAVNNAVGGLLDKNQQLYKPPAPSGVQKEHKGVFGPGAFAKDDTESEFDDETEPEEIPDIPEEIKAHQDSVSEQIESYFSIFGESLPELPNEFKAANLVIRVANLRDKRPPERYQVDEEVLGVLKKAQLHVIEIREKKGAKEAENQFRAFREQCDKTCRQRSFQWPGHWAEVMVKPVRARLDEINKSKSNPQTDEDTPMPDATSPPLPTEKSALGDRTKQLGPGYTSLGDKILGYRPIKTWSHYDKTYYTRNITYFVEIPGSVVFRVLSGRDIGHAALTYDGLPEDEKNDVQTHLRSVEDGLINPSNFDRILAIGAKVSGYEDLNRYPNT